MSVRSFVLLVTVLLAVPHVVASEGEGTEASVDAAGWPAPSNNTTEAPVTPEAEPPVRVAAADAPAPPEVSPAERPSENLETGLDTAQDQTEELASIASPWAPDAFVVDLVRSAESQTLWQPTTRPEGSSNGADQGASGGGAGEASPDESDDVILLPVDPEGLLASLPVLPPVAPAPPAPEATQADPGGATWTGPPAPDTTAPTTRPQAQAAAPASHPKAEIVLVATAATLAAAGTVGAAAWVAAPWGTLSRLLPMSLFARITRAKALDNPTRRAIMDLVEAQPGISMTRLRDTVGVGSGTMAHHLRLLEDHGLVASVKSGRRRCYFAAAKTPSPPERRLRAALGSKAAARVFRVIHDRPGVRQKDLAARLGVSPTAVIFQTRRLEDCGAVEGRRVGREVAYWPTASALGVGPVQGAMRSSESGS